MWWSGACGAAWLVGRLGRRSEGGDVWCSMLLSPGRSHTGELGKEEEEHSGEPSAASTVARETQQVPQGFKAARADAPQGGTAR